MNQYNNTIQIRNKIITAVGLLITLLALSLTKHDNTMIIQHSHAKYLQ